MKARELISSLRKSIDTIRQMMKIYPDLEVWQGLTGFDYGSRRANRQVTDFHDDGYQIKFYQELDPFTRVYAKHKELVAHVDEDTDSLDWIDIAMAAEIKPDVLFKAVDEAHGNYYINSPTFAAKFAEYNQKWWDKKED